MLNLVFPALLLLAQPAAAPADIPSEEVTAPAAPTPAGTPPAAPAAATTPKAATPAATASAAKTPAAASGDLKPLGFVSQRVPFVWDKLITLNAEVDGLKINSIYFNKRSLKILKSAEFGTHAVVAATNTANATRIPGFAVAVFDADDHLLGVATGGPKFGGIPMGETENFDMSFSRVMERIPKADHFILSVELSD
jgi:hypothetical protein